MSSAVADGGARPALAGNANRRSRRKQQTRCVLSKMENKSVDITDPARPMTLDNKFN
jgi:hypothetical protein